MIKTKTKKICILTSVHPALDIRIFQKQARTLAKAGYEVVLVAPHPRAETLEGVRIVPVERFASRKKRMLETTKQVWQAALREKADIYHFHDPELIPIGLALRFSRHKVIYDIHEDLPADILDKPWIAAPLRKLVASIARGAESLTAYYVDALFPVTESIARRFPKYKTTKVQNFPMCSELQLENAIPYLERPRQIIYLGGINEVRGIREMVLALELAKDVQLCLVGQFENPATRENLLKHAGWLCVLEQGQKNRSEVAQLLGQVRAGLVLFHPIANHISAQPNKLFEYMSAGIPVIASDFPLWKEIVEGVGCGLCVDPMNPRAIADAITYLMDHPLEAKAMGERGRAAVEKTYNWESESKHLLNAYLKLIGAP